MVEQGGEGGDKKLVSKSSSTVLVLNAVLYSENYPPQRRESGRRRGRQEVGVEKLKHSFSA